MGNYYAFDFDGVICNSAAESGITAWRAAHALWPERVDATPSADFIERFPRLRPVIETGHENVAVVALVVNGHSDEDILNGFPALRDELLAAGNFDALSMRRAFGAARDAWLRDDEDSWLAAQNAYPGIVEAINTLDAPLCIITTKEDRFTRKLVARFGMRVDADRIYALESFEGGGKRSVLAKLASEFPGHRLHFFEDRLATLQTMRDTSLAQLYLVDWGYNTAPERAQAASIDSIEVLNTERFLAIINAA
ncbi:MAG: phosphoglycolate phosphatase-like HAD superfamily hydrolase [Gammaproteobacteria bacterium]|jgi:phosphoglycolate phosphatase-like HAD superfamily hydrolase